MNLQHQLEAILPTDRVKTRLIDRYAFASDASHFYLVPKAVVQPLSIDEIQRLFAFSRQHRVSLTFRAGGTSLSGQAVTDGILVDLSRHWRRIAAENDGAQVRVEPAVIGGNVNVALKKFGRKMGPDPASINAAMMGGILSNNSSGMCCGVQHNSYHTLRHIAFVLPNGLLFSTEKPDDYVRFEREAADVADGLRQLRRQILDDAALQNRIRAKYRQKNTTGYSLNAFLDYEHPLDILAHLMIGAEGTLGFIAEAVLDTVSDLPHKMTGMLYFETPEAACDAIFDLKATGAEALEFMDRPALRSVENQKGVPDFVKNLPARAAAILCEYQADTEGVLLEKWAQAQPIIQRLPLLEAPNFTQNAAEQAAMWKIRKGMYPSVASVRAKGTATMLEDLTFPVEKLGAAIVDVQSLFEKYGYADGIIFGHAKDGNLHFCISQNFSEKTEIERFERFNDDLFELVLKKYDGALKGEHGTGRAVAPYVEAEWGTEGYAMMKSLKQLVDPDNLLNPNVIISEDKNVHLRDLKIMPVVEEEVDKCVECGYCERRCPSRDFTLTPRQRIGIRRALRRLEAENDRATHAEILKDYQFNGMDTCAVDGMCATDCPVSINTGELIKRLRRENHAPSAQKWAMRAAQNFAALEGTVRFAMKTGFAMNGLLGQQFMHRLTAGMRVALPSFPLWSNQMGAPPALKLGRHLTDDVTAAGDGHAVVYFASCITRMMGGATLDTFLSVCRKANLHVLIPHDLPGACCGQIFSSKGFTDAFRFTANATLEKAWEWTKGGELPIVMDVTSCTNYLQTCAPYLTEENKKRHAQLRFLDSIDFAADVLLPRLRLDNRKNRIVFHPVCSVTKMGLLPKLEAIGRACAHEADVPTFAGCCGMAGDRGFYFPELTQSATHLEAAEVNMKTYDGYYSSGKTCEMALSEAVGQSYESILKLLDEVAV